MAELSWSCYVMLNFATDDGRLEGNIGFRYVDDRIQTGSYKTNDKYQQLTWTEKEANKSASKNQYKFNDCNTGLNKVAGDLAWVLDQNGTNNDPADDTCTALMGYSPTAYQQKQKRATITSPALIFVTMLVALLPA